jgi:hypothetical protein
MGICLDSGWCVLNYVCTRLQSHLIGESVQPIPLVLSIYCRYGNLFYLIFPWALPNCKCHTDLNQKEIFMVITHQYTAHVDSLVTSVFNTYFLCLKLWSDGRGEFHLVF